MNAQVVIRKRIRLAGRLAVLLAGCTDALPGQETPTPDLRLPGVFETELPQTELKHHLRLTFRPHFGDLAKYDHLRVPIGVRYGLGAMTEASAEMEAYVSHGLKSVAAGKELGLAGYRLTAKQRLPAWTWLGGNAAGLGLTFSQPVGSPPERLTDGRRHLTPFVTLTRPVPGYPRLTGFVSTEADFTAGTAFRGVRRQNAFLDDSIRFTSGILWRGRGFIGTLETSYLTSAFGSDENRTVFAVRPGVSWRLSDWKWFHPEGRWTVGLAPKFRFGPDGTEVEFNVKFRGDFDFKRWLGRKRK